MLLVERDLSCAQNVLSSVHYLSEKSLLLIPVVCQIKISVGNKNQSDMIKFHSAFDKVLHEKIALYDMCLQIFVKHLHVCQIFL